MNEFNISSRLEKTINGILEPSTLHPLRIERQTVEACDVLHDQRVWKSLQEYRKELTHYEHAGTLPDSVAAINSMTVQDFCIPEDLSHQDVTGRQIIQQAALIEAAPFLKAITDHPTYKEVPGFEKQRQVLIDTARALNLLGAIGNSFMKKKLHPMRSSPAEVTIGHRCYGTIWPAGINLYSILREMYPVFHAQASGQIPVCVAENFEHLLDNMVDRKAVRGIGRFTVDDDGRFLGLYPVAEVPEDQVTLDSPFVAQDQLGRRAIARRILADAMDIVRQNKEQRVLVIDYAGGVGNISELLLKQLYALPDDDIKKRLMHQLRIAVIDIADDQLGAGRNRFDRMSQKPELKGINDKIIFLHGDVSKPLSEAQRRKAEEKFGMEFLTRSVHLGMTAYTTGALDNLSREDGLTYAEAMADEMFGQCWRIYAADFSSPMWRLEGFLQDTGRWGNEYLRAVHGVADQKDENTPLNKALAAGLRLRYGLTFNTVADFVRFMASGPGLASHYHTAWPGSDGHNSGYSVTEDGSMKKPGILSFTERLKGYGARVDYKSKVWLFATSDLGRASKGTRAWAFIPGWIGDFVVAENEKHRPGVK